MARIRSIKPEAFTSETLAAVPVAVRWTFAGLWTYCDDGGRGRGDARLVKAAIYPLDDEMAVDVVESHLASLEAAGLLCRYESAGRTYLHVINFGEHQHPNKPQSSKLPECSRSTHGGLPDPEGSPTPCSSSRRGVGVGGDTPTVPATSAGAAPVPIDSLTDTQRSKPITDAYAAIVPLSKWPAINGLVLKAIRTRRYSDAEVLAAILRLATEGRPVTVETLRVEIEGLPPSTNGGSPRKREGDRILRDAMHDAREGTFG